MAKKPKTQAAKTKKVQILTDPTLEIVQDEPVPELYIDGFTGMLTKDGVVKLNLHADVMDIPSGELKRRIVTRLIMPLPVLASVSEALQGALKNLAIGTAKSVAAPKRKTKRK